ncbi:hypothetical protein JZ751_022715 [Albula glossodonta]|uniref:Uncharacterized protein n=1 Tax=Albula glossodonta TaxID=121402 RepID=A0A8T2PFZ9_9TELE|nr:hypothetical protein JZ751_022715 [Albula glossodonta]
MYQTICALFKVKLARRSIKSPQVQKFDCIEHDRKFWCYCCGLEVPKHVSNGNLTVLFGGLLEHMATFKAEVAKALDTFEENEDILTLPVSELKSNTDRKSCSPF